MTAFVTGADRSRANAEEMHSLLLSHFASDSAYADVTTAVASFVPGGVVPFYDEDRLAGMLREFLRGQNVSVPDAPPDAPQEQPGVWPPPPKPGAFYQNDKNEK